MTGGRVWVSYGAQAGDCGNYKGRVVGVPLTGATYLLQPADPAGWRHLESERADRGRRREPAGGVRKWRRIPRRRLRPHQHCAGTQPNAKVVDSFAPADWAANNRLDVGLGSQGVALIGTNWAVLGGKSGPVYVLKQSDLGGIGGQVDVQNICLSFGGAAVNGNIVYLPCMDGVRAVRVDVAGQLHVLWHASGSINGSPVIGGGRVWALDTTRRRAARARSVHRQEPRPGQVGVANRFATPALYGADVIVPTLAGIAVVRTS